MNNTPANNPSNENTSSSEPPPPDDPSTPSTRGSGYSTSFSLAAVAVVIIALSTFGFVSAGLETGKYKLLSIFVVPLYVKRKQDKTLENFTRGEIFGFINAHPGTYFNHMKYALNLNNGTLAYHLNVLEHDKLVYSQTDGRYRRFYPVDARMPSVNDENGKIHTFIHLNPTQDRIINVIQNEPGLTQKEIAKLVGKSRQVVNYNINSMAEQGIIKLERDGKNTRCYVNGLHRMDDPREDIEWERS